MTQTLKEVLKAMTAIGEALRLVGNAQDRIVDAVRPEFRLNQILRAEILWDLSNAMEIAAAKLEGGDHPRERTNGPDPERCAG